jgi:four helix bundle protein
MAGQNYRDLIAWQKAMDLVEGVYRLTRQFPRDELYGLTSQVRRAAVSVPSNIAEGQGRGGDAEFCRFLWIAHASVRELETQLPIAVRVEYEPEERVRPLLEQAAEVGRLIRGLINAKGG